MIKSIIKLLIGCIRVIPYFFNKVVAVLYRIEMGKCGKNVHIVPLGSDLRGLNNFYFGNNISVPRGAVFYSTNARLVIKDNVIFGPRPTIITGDHRIDVIGTPIIASYEKLPENDMDVAINEDVWAGANVTILKGVIVGRGAVIAAGAVLNKSVPPYSIVGGVPAKVLKYRFTVDEILEHERILYPEEKRFTREYLESLR